MTKFSHKRRESIVIAFLLLSASALTLVLAVRTFSYLFNSVTNVPYPDQWVMLEEIKAMRSGQSGWSYLWSPYWGHRPLLPRLMILFSVNYLRYSMLPFIITNVAAQLGMVLVLVLSLRRLFPDHGRLFWVSTIAAVHLLLSSLQMEIFVVGIGIMYTVGYASAVSAIVVLGSDLEPWLTLKTRLQIAVLLGFVSTTFVAIGPLIWPILILEAWLVRTPPKHLAILAAFSAIFLAVYSIGYSRPDMGMGVKGVIRHPLQAFAVTAFVLGGPISIYEPWLGVVAGAIGIISASGIATYFVRSGRPKPAVTTVVIVVAFFLGSAVSVTVGRITPEALNGHTGLPVSRYLAPAFVFWAALFAVSLSLWTAGRLGRVMATAISVVVLILTCGTWPWQWRLSREWASISQGYDAIASGLLLGISDQQYMSRIVSDEGLRKRVVEYMREQKLSVFAEPRAGWIDQEIKAIAPVQHSASCRAKITSVPLSGPPPAFRIAGTLTIDGGTPNRLLDVLLAEDNGAVRGLARTLPAQSEYSPAADFLGYARGSSTENFRVFVLSGDRLSHCTSSP